MPRGRVFLVAAAALAVAIVAVPLFAQWRWARHSGDLRQRVADSAAAAPAGRIAHADLGELPAPIARYLRRALPDGQPRARLATLSQQAEFRMSETEDAWSPLTATQIFTAEPPAFVWDARIRMAPGLSVLVRDSYAFGGGSIRASVLGVYTVADQSARPELDAGALQRYLAELIWMPTALAPGGRVTWAPIDDRSARATITDAETTVSLDFTFGADGRIAEIYTPARMAERDGRFVPTPWRVRCDEHGVFAGVTIPVRCEVQWERPGGDLPYWRGRITSARY